MYILLIVLCYRYLRPKYYVVPVGPDGLWIIDFMDI